MITLIIVTALLVTIALWSSANDVNMSTEHHEAEVSTKSILPQHQGSMMYMYRHGYLGEMDPSYSPQTEPVLQHEVSIKTPAPAGPGILKFTNNHHLYHEVEVGEKVTLEVRKVIKKHKITKKESVTIHPVSILKANGRKIKI